MYKIIRIVDIFSFNPNLCFNGEYRYRSFTGTLVSLMFYGIIVILGLVLLRNYMNDSVMTIIQSDFYGYDNEIKLSDDLILIRIYDEMNSPIPESLTKPYILFTYENNGTSDIKLYNMKKCEEKDFVKDRSILLNVTQYYCLNTSALEHKFIKNSEKLGLVSNINIYISFCNSTTVYNNDNCMSKEEREKYKDKIRIRRS